MKTLPLGTTGTSVSEACLGTMFFGTAIAEDRAFELLDRYVESGGSFLDTANVYYAFLPGTSGGESETVIGRWMEARNNRSEVFVATKVGVGMPGVERGLRASQIVRECESSLKRLQVDTIDLYYAHADDRMTPVEEVLEAFSQLARQGKILHIGASNFMAWRLRESACASELNGYKQYCCIQQWDSYLRPRRGVSLGGRVFANEELLDYCNASSMTLIAYGPLLGGIYNRTDKKVRPEFLTAENDERQTTLKSVAAELGATANQVVYTWLRRSHRGLIPIVAASTLEQLEENLDSLEMALSDEQFERLSSAGC